MSVSYDPDFVASLTHLASVLVNPNAAGSVVDAHATPVRSYVPVPGLEAVPCMLCPDTRATTRRVAGRESPVQGWTILLGRSLDVGLAHAFSFVDPDRGGVTRFLYLDGPPVDEHQMGHHWVLAAVEYLH